MQLRVFLRVYLVAILSGTSSAGAAVILDNSDDDGYPSQVLTCLSCLGRIQTQTLPPDHVLRSGLSSAHVLLVSIDRQPPNRDRTKSIPGKRKIFDKFGLTNTLKTAFPMSTISWINANVTDSRQSSSEGVKCDPRQAAANHLADMDNFRHGVRCPTCTRQLLVVTNGSPQELTDLLNAEKCKTNRHPQLRRNYWYTFSRVILAVLSPITESEAEAFANYSSKNMDSHDTLILKKVDKESDSDLRCSWCVLCFHCCDRGRTCLKHHETLPNESLFKEDGRQVGGKLVRRRTLSPHHQLLLDPRSTAFDGNLRNVTITTEMKNIYRTVFDVGERDKQGNVYYHGTEADALRLLAGSMNFSYNIRLAKSADYRGMGVQLENGSWTGFLGRLQRREIEFTTVGYPSTSPNLLPYIDFSYPYNFDFVHVVAKFPKVQFHGFATILLPFSQTIWFELTAAFALFCVLYAIGMNSPGNNSVDVQRLRSTQDDGSTPILYWVTTMPFVLFADTLKQMPDSIAKRVQSDSFRLIATSWGILTTIVGIMYSTVLFSSLFDPTFEPFIDDTEDLAATHRTYIIFIGSGGREFVDGLLKEEQILSFPSTEMPNLYQNHILTGKSVFQLSTCASRTPWFRDYPNVVNASNWNPTTLRLSKNPIASFRVSVYLQKRSVYTNSMSHVIMKFHEHGHSQYLEAMQDVPRLFKEFDLRAMSRDPKALWMETATQVPLSLGNHLSGAFWILLIGHTAAGAVFLVELLLGGCPWKPEF